MAKHNIAREVVTAERRKAAVELRMQGLRWHEIADRLGYADRAAAYTDVRRALEKAVADLSFPLEAHRQLELDRLDAMQNALWPKILDGDPRAVDSALRLMDRRAKLLGLDAPQRVEVLTLDAIDAAIADLEQQLTARRSEAGTPPATA